MVSMVMPEAGLLAVVAMALAATEVKKNEKTSVKHQAQRQHRPRDLKAAEEDGHAEGADHDAEQNGDDRNIAVGALGLRRPRRGGRRAARCRTSRPRRAAI